MPSLSWLSHGAMGHRPLPELWWRESPPHGQSSVPSSPGVLIQTQTSELGADNSPHNLFMKIHNRIYPPNANVLWKCKKNAKRCVNETGNER